MRLSRLVLATALAAMPVASGWAGNATSWLSWGGDDHNMRDATAETAISPATAKNLVLKWSFTASGDIRANPTVEGNALYLTSVTGSQTSPSTVYRLNAKTGAVVWSKPISSYVANSPTAQSYSSPAICPNFVVIGLKDPVNGATLLALDKATGTLLWKTVIDSTSMTTAKSSPIVSGNTIFAGTSSYQEQSVGQQGFTPTFRASVQALDMSGKILWSYHTVPPGYTGGAVWASNFVVDTKTNLVFATTGNNYTIPAAAETCVQANTKQSQQRACLDPADFEDSVVALNMTTGALQWGRSFVGADTAEYGGPDYDFGSGPNLFTAAINGVATDVLGAGHKSGSYFAMNPKNGRLIWSTAVGPGGLDGGILWGSATDGQRVYVAIANSAHTPFNLGPPSNITGWTGGSWQALNAATGALEWQVPVAGTNLLYPQYPASGLGAMTYANGVVFAPSMSGDLVALDAASGATLWSYTAAASVVAGAVVVNGSVYWGSGDLNAKNGGVAGDVLYAFGL